MEVDVVSAAIKKNSKAGENQAPVKINLTDPILVLEREVLKVKLQLPALATGWVDLEEAAFSFPLYDQLRKLIDQQSDLNIQALLDNSDSDELKSLITELTVEPIRTDGEVSDRYINSIFARLREVALSRVIAEIKSTKLMFTTNKGYENANNGKNPANIRPSKNNLRMMNFR